MPAMNEESFLWYDFETFGADPRRDRPAQFGAVRTTPDLEPVGRPEVFYCKPADDVLPQPMACLITGITPQAARERGLPENEFAARIFDLMSQPGTCVVGYNNFRFDDEVTRHLFWRNFIDPYRREYANGNSRFDLIDLMRLARALRPAGIEWPDHDDGRPSFRLEDLAAANALDTGKAHDALADVETTIAMARRLRRSQPRLWRWALTLRDKQRVDHLLSAGEPLLHASSRFPAVPGCSVAPVLPLARHPFIRSQWLVWNLNEDPTPFLALGAEELADRYWTAAADLPEGIKRVPVKTLRNNRCPMLAPMNVLTAERARDLAIDPRRVRENADRLAADSAFIERIGGLFGERRGAVAPDPELDLYGGFPPDRDRPVMQRVAQLDGERLRELGSPFIDERLNELLFRSRARLWPETLDDGERQRWETYRRRRLVDDPELASVRLDEYRMQVRALIDERPGQAAVLKQLTEWPTEIGLDEMTADSSGSTNYQ